MKSPIKTYAANTEGRDFVIGDLHGTYSVLTNLLSHLDFDTTKDRLFSVGDLVDRGPDSLRCLELLYEPWFHSVISNHEQMMWEAFNGGYLGDFWLVNGGAWGAEALGAWRRQGSGHVPTDDQSLLFDLVEKVGELPFIMTVEKRDGTKVHIIHAELPPGDPITDADLADPAKVLTLCRCPGADGDYLTWGRHLFYSFYCSSLSDLDKVRRTVAYHHGRRSIFNPNLSPIISGHTIVQRPLTLLGQTNIDTGAFMAAEGDARWESLTALELNTWRFYQATKTAFREVQPVVVTAEDLQPKHVIGPPSVNSPQDGGADEDAD